MSRHSLHIKLILLIALLCCALGGHAQQRRLAQASGNNKGLTPISTLNIGITVGPTATMWLHPSSDLIYTYQLKPYKIKPSFGYFKDDLHDQSIVCFFGGIALEYLFRSNLSIGFDALYAQRATGLYFVNSHFPIGIDQYVEKRYDLVADYKTVELLVPLTYYMSSPFSGKLQPFVYAGPKLSYVLSGTMSYRSIVNTQTDASDETSLGFNNYNPFNVGATLGVGTQYRFESNRYYTLLKLDLSANFNTLNTFGEGDLDNEFNYKRYSADAELAITFMLPVNKNLKDACYYFQ